MTELDRDILEQIGYLCDSADEEIVRTTPEVEQVLDKLNEVRDLIYGILERSDNKVI